jgi:ribosomal protein S18 acetylase RimI-like enzyme
LTAVPFNVLADLDDEPAGMVSATEPDSAETIELISMWVAPFARGRGVGDALIEAVVGWAESHLARRLGLRVTVGNEAALALYRRHGFTETGLVEQNTDGSSEAEMVREKRAPLRAEALPESP